MEPDLSIPKSWGKHQAAEIINHFSQYCKYDFAQWGDRLQKAVDRNLGFSGFQGPDQLSIKLGMSGTSKVTSVLLYARVCPSFAS